MPSCKLTTNGDGYLVNANALQIDINIPLIEIVKTADETIAAIGDIVTYTVTTRNTSQVDATNAMFFDLIAAGSSFIDGSVTIDNVAVASADPTVGFPIGDLPAGAAVVVKFQVRIDSLPDSEEIRNQAQVAYDFKSTPDSPVLSNWVPSNIVRIPVVDAGIVVVKSADTAGPVDVGDTVTFTLDVTATGNTPVTTTVTDLIPQGAALVAGSVAIGGVPQAGADPAAGINLGTLNPGDTVTVTFRITVSAFPESGNIVNQATDIFTFQAGSRSIPGTTSSNIVTIPVNIPFIGQATLTLIKASSLTAAVVGDVITYTVNVQNLDPVVGTFNVLLLDPIPAGSAFVPGSVTVNGVSQLLASPVTGIPLGNIGPLTTVPVTFQVTVTSVPVPAVLTNQATANYTSGGQALSSGSNIVNIPVYQPALTANKLAGTIQATVGQTVVFTLLLQNTGSIAVTPVVTDIVPPQASFIADSLRINGVLIPGTDPAAGITLEPLAPGGSTAITFDIVVNGLPPGQLLTNQASAAYTYQPSPGRVLTGVADSNPVTVLITVTGVTLTKSADLSTAVIGDIVTYELVFTNTSTGPVTAVILTDPAVEGAVFIPGTVVVNGVPDAAAVPASGIAVGTVASGGVVTVTYRQRVDSRPANSFIADQASAGFTSDEGPSTVISNPVNIAVAEPSLTLEKSTDTRFALIGDLVRYFLTVTNTGNYNVNVFLSDPIPPGSVFVPNSLVAGGTPLPGVDPSEGEFIGTIEAGDTFEVTFLVEVVSVPPSQALINRGTLIYEFVLPDGRSFSRSLLSNEVNIPVAAPPQAQLLKSVNTNELDVGMLFVFTLQFLNPGPFPVTEATLFDPLPAGLVFISGSVTLDGTARPAAIPSAGITLGNVPSGRTAVVTFTARASAPQIAVNQASASFAYLLPDGRRLTDAATSNPVRVRINENEE
ncbi:hypothetical protein [Paenibacillus sp. 1P03SA]|uniref:DUF7507 domain-containing protein n=1 Tax=Paenibacillus sp. 1P03SA TaxID=3132294 RepID=UPI0039A2718B